MHILFLTDNFPPEVNAPASRTHEHCREWVAAGHRVTVVTCAPNFPSGRVFAGYANRIWQQQRIDGIRVIRVWTYIARNEGFLRRVLDYLSFMVSGFVAALFVRKVDVVVGTSPQLFTACGAWLTGALKRRPYVFELRDLWPESIKAVGAMKESLAIRWLELFLYRRATLIVSVTHSFRRNLTDRGIDSGKIEVITNGVDLSRFQPRAKDAALLRELGLAGKFVAGYVGTHGMAHGLETLLEAARLLDQESDGDRFRVLFLGDGASKAELMARAEALRLRNVLFVDSVPKDQVARYWSVLDASIIHLKNSDLFRTVIPSKLFECMGMGVPVLHGVQGESAEIVRREGIGIVFEPGDAASLVAAIRKLDGDAPFREECRTHCLQAAPRYDRRTLAAAMLASLLGVAEREKR